MIRSFGEINHSRLKDDQVRRLKILKKYATRVEKMVLQCSRCFDFIIAPNPVQNPVCPHCMTKRRSPKAAETVKGA